MTREGIACDKIEMLMMEGKKEAEQWKIVMEQEGHAEATVALGLREDKTNKFFCNSSDKN